MFGSRLCPFLKNTKIPLTLIFRLFQFSPQKTSDPPLFTLLSSYNTYWFIFYFCCTYLLFNRIIFESLFIFNTSYYLIISAKRIEPPRYLYSK